MQSFFSIIALLLQKRSATAMNAYLDRLHYPEGPEQVGPHLVLAERIAQLFDLGLYRKLSRRFAVLREREREAAAWRDSELLERLELEPAHTRRQWARKRSSCRGIVDSRTPAPAGSARFTVRRGSAHARVLVPGQGEHDLA